SRNGVRWSEMWRLPYWNPTLQLTVDPMHCLLEGLARFHVCDVLGLTTAKANKAQPDPPAFSYDFPDYTPESGVELGDKEIRQFHQAQPSLPRTGDAANFEAAFPRLHKQLMRASRNVLIFLSQHILPVYPP